MALRSTAAVFTYCRSRGLFAGISLEGSCLIERKETNQKYVCPSVRLPVRLPTCLSDLLTGVPAGSTPR